MDMGISHLAEAVLPVLGHHPAEKLGAASGSIRKTSDPLGGGEATAGDHAGQRERHRGAHDISHPLAESQPGRHAAFEVGLDLFRLRRGHLAHHVAMRPLDHASKGRVKRQITERGRVIHVGHPLFVFQKRVLAALEIRQEREIRIAGLTVGRRPAGIHHLEPVIAIRRCSARRKTNPALDLRPLPRPEIA